MILGYSTHGFEGKPTDAFHLAFDHQTGINGYSHDITASFFINRIESNSLYGFDFNETKEFGTDLTVFIGMIPNKKLTQNNKTISMKISLRISPKN